MSIFLCLVLFLIFRCYSSKHSPGITIKKKSKEKLLNTIFLALLIHFHIKAFLFFPFLQCPWVPFEQSHWSVSWGLEYNLRLLTTSVQCYHFQLHRREFFFSFPPPLLLVVGQIHCVSIFQPLLLPLSNSGLMIVILKQSELSNQKQRWWMPRCSVCLFVLGVAWVKREGGVQNWSLCLLVEVHFLDRGCSAVLSQAALIKWNSSVIWIKRGETWGW